MTITQNHSCDCDASLGKVGLQETERPHYARLPAASEPDPRSPQMARPPLALGGPRILTIRRSDTPLGRKIKLIRGPGESGLRGCAPELRLFR